MANLLIVTEKPSVGKAFSGALGVPETEKHSGYIEGFSDFFGCTIWITWCVGHLVQMSYPEAYEPKYKQWRYEDLPILPPEFKYEVTPTVRKQFEVVKKLMNSVGETEADKKERSTLSEDKKILVPVEEVICATDAGREGELIFRLVYEQAKCSKPIKRLWISSMEEKAIAEGFANLRDGRDYNNLYQSARCRSEADWLVGINGTRLFTVLYQHRLTVGRVQTPTLAMLVERGQRITEFQKTLYYKAHIQCEGLDALTESIEQKERATQIVEACQGRQAFVVSVTKEEKKESPPKLYDLTTLQREANRLFGYTAQQTLDYTQSLYEKKLVTYPRTDSRFLTEDMKEMATTVVGIAKNLLSFRDTALAATPDIGRLLNSKKVTDHHAIIPTLELGHSSLEKVPRGELLLLQLIAMKLLSATAQPHIYETTKAELRCSEYQFSVSGRCIQEKGWKEIETLFKQTYVSEQPHKENQEQTPLPALAEGMVFSVLRASVSDHMTSPPKYYTEDTLLSAMEHAGSESIEEEVERKGLGTPATRASIIEKLVEKEFVERKGKLLVATETGNKLITVLPDVIKSPKLTAEWENQLTLIAKGERSALDFMEGIKEMVTELVTTYHQVDDKAKGLFGGEREVIGTCPKCGGHVYESKVNYYCEHRECGFGLFKNNKYFAAMRKELTKAIVQALLQNGRVKVKGLYSKKKNATFAATIVMDASGKYPQFSMEFDKRK